MGSSCYVTIRIKDNKNNEYYGAFLCDDVGYLQNGIANDPDFSLKECLCAADGKQLLDELNKAYGNLFSEFEEEALFEDPNGYKKNHLRYDLEIDGVIGSQSVIEAMPVSQMKTLKIWENVTDDESGSNAEAELDFNTHKASVLVKQFYDEGVQITEKTVNLDTGEEDIVRDGFFEEDEEYEGDEE